MTNPLLEPSPYDSDERALIGRDPRKIGKAEWLERGLDLLTGLKAVRAKCLDCAHTAAEVRKCVCTNCPLWPLRMGSVGKGFRAAQAQIDSEKVKGEQPEALKNALAKRHEKV